MLELLPQVPRYWMFRRFGWPKVMPVNVAVSIISTCNSRCLTCNIWAEHTPGEGHDLTVEEFDRVRAELDERLRATGLEPALSVGFTADPRWAV